MQKQIFNSAIGENYTLYTYPCGFKVYILNKSTYNSSYAIFGTKYGSIDNCFSVKNGEKLTVPEGIAHFLEHKLFESEDGDAFSKFAKTGGSANAFTSFDRTCYLFSCSERFYENLDILLDFVRHPYFTEQTVNKEQGIIGQEIRMYDDNPNWCVFFNVLKALYNEHPVRIDIAGTTDSISEITPKYLYDCYNTFYDLSNMFLCIAGNVNEEKIIKAVNKIVDTDSKKEITRIFTKEESTVNQKYIEMKHSVSMPLFTLGYKLPAEKELTLKEKIVYSAALDILSGECSTLYKKLTDLELVNDEFDSELLCGNGYAAVLISGESKSPKTVQEEINNEIENIVNNGYEEKLLDAVKRAMYADAVRRFDSTENVVMQMVESAVFDYEMFEELEIIKNISYYDILECLKTLNKDNSSLSVVTQK